MGVALALVSLVVVYNGASTAGIQSWMLAGLAALLWAFAFGDRWSPLTAPIATAIVIGLFSSSVSPEAKLWQVPASWADLTVLTPQGAALGSLLYLSVALWSLARFARPLALIANLALLAAPYLFNLLLALAASGMTVGLGRMVLGADLPAAVASGLGRTLMLFAFNEALLLGLGLLMDRRLAPSWRLHLLVLASSALAAFTPLVADFGSTEMISRWPIVVRVATMVLSEALAQAGLWAQVFFLTGMLLDALRGRRPILTAGYAHWYAGLARGAVYGGLFVLLVQLGALVWSSSVVVGWLRAHPAAGGSLMGVLLFPLAKTILESFDGCAPFFARFTKAVREPLNYVRGLIAGLGLGLVLSQGLPMLPGGLRFTLGFAIGAAAYAGADALWDLKSVLGHQRQRMQTWRVYGLGTLLGGFVGGALAWYFDAAQLQAVAEKFVTYAIPYFPAGGKATTEYVIYPLFSKWGEIDLGSASGGVKLLYAESLSGVINWSLAAPLFSINLIALTALFKRSLDPLKELFSAAGFATLVEQAVRVLRWGLWMAPIIYTFLRLAADPSWYNQDGAVRSAVASVQSALLPTDDFRNWSLAVFLGLLAYDWLRVLIWFDHMGLRVATLVNLSFVGGDALDEKASRFLGHSARTRCIPEAIRRFLTWAPLLIPFYIPRGGEWNQVWDRAESLQAAPQSLLPAVASLLLVYQTAAAGAILAVAAVLLLRRRGKESAPPRAALSPYFTLANGQYTAEYGWDGRGFSHVTSAVRPGFELDLTRRADDPLQLRGKFFYLRELDSEDKPIDEPWSLGSEPMQKRGPDYSVTKPSPSNLHIVNSHSGIRAEASVSLDPRDPVENWRISLTNREQRARVVELTSYQELAVGPVDAYRRSPFFAAMHVGTCFVAPLNAIIARNRLMRNKAKDPALQRMCREVGFHAVRADKAVRLIGYEDSRAHFIGLGTLRRPGVFADQTLRDPADEGLLYTFDPAASLRLKVELPPSAAVEIAFADGYAEDEYRAAALIARHLDVTEPNEAVLKASFTRTRSLRPAPKLAADVGGFYENGRELSAPCDVQRPWAHLVANPLGHGFVASSEGEIFSFGANAQQNALSPFSLDSVPTQLPGQAIYVFDPKTGVAETAGFAPYRRPDARHEALYGLGYARYRKEIGELELDLTAFVPPDRPIEIKLFRIRNRGKSARRLRIVPYMEIVLAEVPADSRGRVRGWADAAPGVLYLENAANDFRKGVAFAATNLECQAQETVRARFVGGEGRDLTRPLMLERGHADVSQVDDGRRIASFVADLEIPAGEEAAVIVVLGQAADQAQAAQLARAYLEPRAAERALEQTRAWWNETLSVLRVETNQPSFDRLVNDWLPYQLLCSRLWGRTGPSQRSGAYGFRDQLQDVLPLTFLKPEWARSQIVLHAAQQFIEGDCVKWWHPSWEGKTGIAVRTRASDPHLWLPYVVSRYVEATGDTSVLEEQAAFLEGEPVPKGHEGFLFAARPSRDTGSVYEHCRRAIEYTLARRGVHGLPLLGSGDWNDALDVPGIKGKGESVWLGFFLHDVLTQFTGIAERFEGLEASSRYLNEAKDLSAALEAMWRDDGYLRAITDDGEEFRLCSALMAAWPLMSGAADAKRGQMALETGLKRLEKSDRVLLLTPPFTEDSLPYPGRIAEYPPGVRENGGQYSHGASWLIDALLLCAGQAASPEVAESWRVRAWDLWMKISPLSKSDRPEIYGLPPHQQPADIYDGPGVEGRGGWSWYTGAAARMLSTAYQLLGLRIEGGELKLSLRRGPLEVKRVSYRGQQIEPSEDRNSKR
ncbi:MAG: GH36-type glycosyl hydrolase domain-containing protein [Burkholderiales bacterium]